MIGGKERRQSSGAINKKKKGTTRQFIGRNSIYLGGTNSTWKDKQNL